ncbi:MAG: hypothetical protein KDA93_14315 [Planctomycetaceae bacterium]|nr:hypothetical protein [Planctomycetaceae bacterium]
MPTSSQLAPVAAVITVIGCLALLANLLIGSTASPTHGYPPPEASLPDAYRAVSPSIICGATPQSVEEFRGLANQRVHTIVSVDGAPPDVESAAVVQLRYVHIPIGYDGIPQDAVARMTRVLRECERPIYVHCHHGKHRGPAAAAVCAMIAGEIDPPQARKLLSDAGTSHDYAGLWRDVQEFTAFPDDATLPEISSRVEVEPMTDLMVKVDDCWDKLQIAVQAENRTQAREQASILEQLFRESIRLHRVEDGCTWLPTMLDAEHAATSLRENFENDYGETSRWLNEIEESCRQCHKYYRN